MLFWAALELPCFNILFFGMACNEFAAFPATICHAEETIAKCIFQKHSSTVLVLRFEVMNFDHSRLVTLSRIRKFALKNSFTLYRVVICLFCRDYFICKSELFVALTC